MYAWGMHSFGLIPNTPNKNFKNVVYTIRPTHSKLVDGSDPTIIARVTLRIQLLSRYQILSTAPLLQMKPSILYCTLSTRMCQSYSHTQKGPNDELSNYKA